jgi:hypothetical protein
MFRKFKRRKRENAVDIIVNYLRALAAKQAVCTAVWAVSVLKRFARHVSKDQSFDTLTHLTIALRW